MPSGADYQSNPRVEGGQVEIITVTTPSAGADFSHTIPDGYTYEVRAMSFQLVASATVANRQTGTIITDSADVELCRMNTTGATTANQTVQNSVNPGYTGTGNSLGGVGHVWGMPLRDVRLLPGWKIKSAVTNLQAGDQISVIRLVVIRRPFPN